MGMLQAEEWIFTPYFFTLADSSPPRQRSLVDSPTMCSQISSLLLINTFTSSCLCDFVLFVDLNCFQDLLLLPATFVSSTVSFASILHSLWLCLHSRPHLEHTRIRESNAALVREFTFSALSFHLWPSTHLLKAVLVTKVVGNNSNSWPLFKLLV